MATLYNYRVVNAVPLAYTLVGGPDKGLVDVENQPDGDWKGGEKVYFRFIRRILTLSWARQ